MERRLYRIKTLGGLLTIASGMVHAWNYGMPWFREASWLHVKLVFVALLVVYSEWCGVLVRRFAERRNVHSHRWYRWFNEVPAVLLLVIVVLAVVRPI
jgi:putative membrane protein